MKKRTVTPFRIWLTIICVSTIVCGCIYLSVQQSYRMNANDPQIQLTEDASAALSQGLRPDLLIPRRIIVIDQSLAPFVMVFDSHGKLLGTNASLHGHAPLLPSGLFTNQNSSHEQRFTWQPAATARLAAVMIPYKSSQGAGFVLFGRSLREVEKRELKLEEYVSLAWVAGIIGSFLFLFILPL